MSLCVFANDRRTKNITTRRHFSEITQRSREWHGLLLSCAACKWAVCRPEGLHAPLFRILCPLVPALTDVCLSCECTNTERPCEYLTSDAVFVARVLEIVAVKHPMEKESTPGCSMRFAVGEPPQADLGVGETIETGGSDADCVTPLPVGRRYLIFAYTAKRGESWTGMSGNQELAKYRKAERIPEQYRELIRR